MCITFMDLHLQSIYIFSKFRNSTSIYISFSSLFNQNLTVFNFTLDLFRKLINYSLFIHFESHLGLHDINVIHFVTHSIVYVNYLS